jgi:hypothetical protein
VCFFLILKLIPLTLLDRLHVSQIIANHVLECKRRIPRLQRALPVIIPESNLPCMALEIQRTLKMQLNFECIFMTEDKRKGQKSGNLPGNITTHRNKEEMVTYFKEKYLATGKIFVRPDFIVASSEGPDVTDGVADVKHEFERQMRDFSRIKRYYRAPDQSTYVRFFHHGKIDGKNDDFVMALLMAPYMYRIFCASDKYRNVRTY